MTFAITNWNIEENVDWYVRLEDAGSDMTVGVYYTESDAQHDNNRVAQLTAIAFGTDVVVTLVAESGQSINLFQPESTWHLRVTGEDGDTGKVFKVKQFSDIDGLSHSIFRNTTLIILKATDEIDKHTYAKIVRELPLGIHIPDIIVGDVITFNSTRRNVNENNQIHSHVISGTIDGSDVKLTSSLTIVKYLGLTI
ncbi:hypothetical protein LCGC14_2875010 [marine sediment metagenome]|uniref:Uncharacterized protein n=1 Tax=marine sediment metagenome TaxID=412755 RepID=A0A0F9A9W0_9ZZZZ